MAFRTELQGLRRTMAGQCVGIAQELEAGRATAPFQDKLNQLAGDPTLPVRAAVISDSPESAQALLSQVVGSDYNVCKVVVPTRLGFSEVLLSERGFLLDTGAGAQEFDDVAPFLNALEESRTLQSGQENGLEPLRLKLQAPAHLSGLCLLVPNSLDALVSRPALLSTLTDQADWVFLAGSTGTRHTPAQKQAIQLVLDQVTGLQNIMVPGEETANGAPKEEWWKTWKVGLSLGLVRIGSDLLRSRLSLLTAPDSELRQYLVETRLLRQLEMTLALMDEEIQQLQRQLSTRLNLSKEGLAGPAGAGESRKTSEAVRARLAEESESLLKAAERDAKAAQGTEGEIYRELKAAADRITVDDIDQQEAEVTIKLTLSENLGAGFADLLDRLGRAQLAAALEPVREGLACSVRDAEKALEAATGARHKLSVALPDESDLRAALGAVARPEFRYRSEMPRPTLATRFNAARQAIMGITILGTMLGGAVAISGEDGSSMRLILAGIMIPLLVVGFLWTYVSFRKKERLTLEKEVERIQEGVLTESRRALGELLREQQAALAQQVQKAVRAAQQQIEAAFSQVEQQRTRDAEQLRKRTGDQQRSIEQRLGRLRDYLRQLATQQAKLADARKVQQAWLGDWINRFNTQPKS